MVLGYLPRVAEPRMDDVGGVRLHQLRLPARPEVLEEFGPRLDAGMLDGSQNPGVGVALAVKLAGQDVGAACRSLVEGLLEALSDLGEDRHDPRLVRIKRSLELLKQPSESLAGVALELGLSSQSHFTRLFSDLTGMTPAKYHKQFKRTVG